MSPELVAARLERALETIDMVTAWVADTDEQSAGELRVAATDVRDLRVELEIEAFRAWRLVPA
jgi:hypothetical protein